MRFFLDNDVPDALVGVLRNAGHQAERLRDALPIEADDLSVLQYAHERETVLLTCNRNHFLRLAQSHAHHGIIVVIRRQTRLAECSNVLRLIRKAGETGIVNNINFA